VCLWSTRTIDGNFGLAIEFGAMGDLDRMCTIAGDIETGGVLIGRYSPDLATAIVSEATPPPPDSEQGPAWFIRGVVGLREKFKRRWRSKERTYYLGEWHFHPTANVEPSQEDIAQMSKICHDLNYHCGEPVLLIAGKSNDDQERVYRAFVFPRGNRYMELLRLSSEEMHSQGAISGSSIRP